MKTIHSIAIAAIGTIGLLALAVLDPEVTFEDAVLMSIGVWAMLLGQSVTMFLLNRKPSNEKTTPVTPSL